jgi:hypothetical protein
MELCGCIWRVAPVVAYLTGVPVVVQLCGRVCGVARSWWNCAGVPVCGATVRVHLGRDSVAVLPRGSIGGEVRSVAGDATIEPPMARRVTVDPGVVLTREDPY